MYMFKSGLFEGIRKQPVNGETSAKIICYYHLSRASHEPKLLCCSLGEGPNGDVNQLLCKADERGRYPGLPLERAFCCIGQRTPELLHSEKDFKWNMYAHVCVSVLLSVQLQLQLDFVPVCLFLLFGTMASRCSQICWTNTFGACAPAWGEVAFVLVCACKTWLWEHWAHTKDALSAICRFMQSLSISWAVKLSVLYDWSSHVGAPWDMSNFSGVRHHLSRCKTKERSPLCIWWGARAPPFHSRNDWWTLTSACRELGILPRVWQDMGSSETWALPNASARQSWRTLAWPCTLGGSFLPYRSQGAEAANFSSIAIHVYFWTYGYKTIYIMYDITYPYIIYPIWNI